MEKEIIHKEYEIISENLRHYRNMRFANLTVFLGLIFGLSVIAFGLQGKPTPEHWLQMLAKASGFVISFIFWMFEYRINIGIDHFQERAVKLEKILGYKLWSTFPRARFIHADKAISLLFIAIGLFWVFTLYKQT